MIQVALPAFMVCDEPNCKGQQQAFLFLLASGGLCFKPSTDAKWQVLVPRGPDAPFVTRCPLHRVKEQLIQPTPAIPGLQREH